ncbi:hypothetical protein EBU91_00475 [bacterium]|nr:hypothetical protein [bacterium]
MSIAKKIQSGFRFKKGRDLQCQNCRSLVINVDEKAVSCLCWKCVCLLLNPGAEFIDSQRNIRKV